MKRVFTIASLFLISIILISSENPVPPFNKNHEPQIKSITQNVHAINKETAFFNNSKNCNVIDHLNEEVKRNKKPVFSVKKNDHVKSTKISLESETECEVELEKLGEWGAGSTITTRVKGDFIYVVEGGGLRVLNFSDQKTFKDVFYFPVNDTASSAELSGNTLFFVEGAYLHVFDITNPYNPDIIGEMVLDGFNTQVEHSFLKDDYLYLVHRFNGCEIIDVSNPQKPVLVGHIERKYIYDLVVKDNFAYFASYEEGIVIYDISDFANPQLVNTIYPGSHVSEIVIKENYLIAGAGTKGLMIYEIKDNGVLELINNVPLYGDIDRLALDENYLVVSINGDSYYYKGSTLLYNLENINDLQLIGGVNIAGSPYIYTNKVFFSCGSYGLKVMKINDIQKKCFENIYPTNSRTNIATYDNFLVISDSDNGISLYNSEISEATHLSSFECEGVTYLNQCENLVFATIENRAVKILKINNQNALEFVSEIDLEFFCFETYSIDKNTLVTPQRSDGIYIWNIEDPYNPTELCHIENNYEDSYYCVYTFGKYLLACDRYYGIDIFDISDIRNPTKISNIPSAGTPYDIVVENNMIYICDGEAGFQLIDISDPSTPVKKGRVETSDRAIRVELKGQQAYVTILGHGVVAIDIQDSNNPYIYKNYFIPGTSVTPTIHNNILYVADLYSNIFSIDLTQEVIDTKIVGYENAGIARGVFEKDGIVYLADDSFVRVLDCRVPSKVVELDRIETYGLAWNLKAVKNLLFVADHSSGCNIYDISDPSNIELISHFYYGYVFDLDVKDNLVFLAAGLSGLYIYNITNPYSPSYVGSFKNVNGSIYDVSAKGENTYISGWYNGLMILDTSDPSNPQLLGQYPTDHTTQSLFVNEPYVYLDNSGIKVIDVTEPTNPVLVGTSYVWDTRNFFIKDNLLYSATGRQGFWIFDISNPIDPQVLCSIDTPGQVSDIYVSDNIYLADGSSGKIMIYNQTASTIDTSLSGNVLNSQGDPIQNVNVHLKDLNNSTIKMGITNSDGFFEINSVNYGTYKIFFDAGYANNYISEWYENQTDSSDAEIINFTEVDKVKVINGTLEKGIIVDGYVKDDENNIVQNISVECYDDKGNYIKGATTNESGYFKLTGISSGKYKFFISNKLNENFFPEWFYEKDSYDSADLIDISSDTTLQNILIAKKKYGMIQANIKDQNGDPVMGAYIDVYNLDHEKVKDSDWYSDRNGDITVSNIPYGSYKIYFDGKNAVNKNLLSEWYSDSVDFETAQVVDIGDDTELITFHANLQFANEIIGNISDKSGVGIYGADVYLYDLEKKIVVSTSDSSFTNGDYRLRNVPDGDFKIYTSIWSSNFLPQWYMLSDSYEQANIVTVTENLEDIDFVLEKGGVINGHVFDKTNTPLDKINVYAFKYNDSVNWHYSSSAESDVNGYYELEKLDTGNYKLMYSPNETLNFLVQYYDDNLYDISSAEVVSITKGEEITVNSQHLTAGGVINGRVLNENGYPVSDAEIKVHNEDLFHTYYTKSNENGYFEVKQLTSGNYNLRVESSENYISTYFGNTHNFDERNLINVTAGITTENIDFILETGGTITGTVKDTFGNKLSDTLVRATTDNYNKTAYTDENGNYKIEGLINGDYIIEYDAYRIDNYVSEYYNDSLTSSRATPVSVQKGVTTENIDAVLEKGAILAGTVTDKSGNPLDSVYIGIYSSNDTVQYYAYTNEDGYFERDGIAPGEYILYANETGYISEYYNNIYNRTDAQQTTLVQEETTSIEMDLGTGGSISGYVKNQAGEGIEEITVRAYFDNGSYQNGGITNSEGFYTIDALVPGDVKVYVRSDSGPYFSEWYGDTINIEDSPAVQITEDNTTENINFTLDVGGSISGTVIDETGSPIENTRISIRNLDGDYYYNSNIYTDESGNYTANKIQTGTYRVYFYQTDNYMKEYYNNVIDSQDAAAVPVIFGQNTPNINATLEKGGGVVGTVKDKHGHGIEGVTVTAYPQEGGYNVSGKTDEDGKYELYGIYPGNAKIQFVPSSNHLAEWYDNAADESSASFVDVIKGNKRGVSVELEDGCSIEGTISNEDDANIYVRVKLYDNDGTYLKYTNSSSSTGHYKFGGLAEGEYKVYFDTTVYTISKPYTPQWYDNKATIEDATVITTTTGDTTSNIDAVLTKGGSISGYVEDEYGNPIKSAYAQAYTEQGVYKKTSLTDSLGNYSIVGLEDGDYKIKFDSSTYLSYFYNTQYYNHQNTFADGDLLTVSAGNEITGVNAVLTQNTDVGENLKTFNIPHIANSDGWKTWLVVDNINKYGEYLNVFLYSDEDMSKMSNIPSYIPGNRQVKLELPLGTSGKVTYFDPADKLIFKEVFYHETDKGIAEFLLDKNSYNNITFTMPQYAAENLTWMGLGIMNPGEEDSDIAIDAFNKQGDYLDSSSMFVKSQSRNAYLLENLFEGLDWKEVAKIKAESPTPITGLNISGYNNEKLLFTKAKGEVPTGNLFIPHIAAEIDQWENKLIFDNNSEQSASFTLIFYLDGSIVHQETIDLSSFETKEYDINLLNQTLGFMPSCGVVELDESNVLVRQSFTSKSDGGVAEFSLNNEKSGTLYFNFPAYIIEDITWMGLAIQNTTETTQTVTLTAYKNGVVVGETGIDINGNDRAVGVVEAFFDSLSYLNIERIKVTGTEGLCGINISGHNLERLLFTPAISIE